MSEINDQQAWNELNEEIENQTQTIRKLEKLILNCFESCLCERFKTEGFDYGETHPVLGIENGARFNTPKVMIKHTIGCEWVYKHPKKPGQSMERILFQTIKHGEGYKSEEEWHHVCVVR
jgi:hypothetical protein